MSMDFDQAQQKNAPVFHGEGIIDVTNFEAMSPDDSLGYMCGCNISIFQDGMIENARQIMNKIYWKGFLL